MIKRELKRIAKEALIREYGYGPAMKDITLLEANELGQYILFSVNGHVYSWDSVTMERRELI